MNAARAEVTAWVDSADGFDVLPAAKVTSKNDDVEKVDTEATRANLCIEKVELGDLTARKESQRRQAQDLLA